MSVLTEARKLIEDPEHWVQGVYAMDEFKTAVLNPRDPGAACFCSIGAVVHALPEDHPPDEEVTRLSRAVRALDPTWFNRTKSRRPAMRIERCITQYNDTHTHHEVLAVWDHAIAEEARTA